MNHPQAPIATMQHGDAKRSFLFQLQGFDEFRQKIIGSDAASMDEEQVDELFTEWAVRTGNLELTVQRIEETRPA